MEIPQECDAQDATGSGDVVAEPTVPCEFWTGIAGSGKTYAWRERIAAIDAG